MWNKATALLAWISCGLVFARSPEGGARVDDSGPDAQSGAMPDPMRVAWVREHAVALKTVEAGHGFEDLEPLRAMIGDARIVALGESTHGSREQFQMKHRLVEFLTTRMGFRTFSIEANMPESFAVDEYVSGGKGNEDSLILGMYFWTWNTEEVADMVRWMRQHNESGSGGIRFTGFDMQTPNVAGAIACDYLDAHDPSLAARARDCLASVKALEPPIGRAYGLLRGRLPAALAAGRTLRLSGWIRTREVTGYAGLWCRADSATHDAVALETMEGSGARGTSEWSPYSIQVDVPDTVDRILFGAHLVGTGAAWFDDLSIEIDGQKYAGEEFDLGFEAPSLQGFESSGVGYLAATDDAVFRSGVRSIRLESEQWAPAPTDIQSVLHDAGEVLAQMRASREAYARTSSEREADWAIQNWRVVHQFAGMTVDSTNPSNRRDEAMAQNVRWILDQAGPDSKIILWAHNWHVSRFDTWMGSYLAATYADKYRPIAFSTAQGEYTAVLQAGLASNTLEQPPIGSAEWYFHAVGAGADGKAPAPLFAVDLREADPKMPASEWLLEPVSFRSIGAVAIQDQFTSMNLREGFDIIIHTDRTSASRQLRKLGPR